MPQLVHLSDRSILALTGKDAKGFLQGVITQDIKKLSEKHALYAAHLTPQGRFMYDFFVIQDAEDRILLDCASWELMPIAKAFHKYLINQDVEFNDMTEDFDIYADITPCKKGEPGDISEKEHEDHLIAYNDPRLNTLGTRFITACSSKSPKGRNKAKEIGFYHNHRIKLGVPSGSYDVLKEKTLLSELFMEQLHGVSFEKGCYVGQELTARTKHRTTPKKHIFIVKYEGKAPELGASITCEGREAGWVFSSSEGQAIGILRLREVEKNKPLFLGENAVKVTIPQWAQKEI